MRTLTIYVEPATLAMPGYRRTGRKGRLRGKSVRDDDGTLRYYDHFGFEHVWRNESGPWYQSISCASLAQEGRIHKPFLLNGRYYVAMGASYRPLGANNEDRNEYRAWRVVPIERWDTVKFGNPSSYHDVVSSLRRRDKARSSVRGFYHGMTAKVGKATWVLLGPPVILKSDPSPRTRQLFMFQ